MMEVYANTPWRQAQMRAAEESDFEDEVADDGSDHQSDTPICEMDSDTLNFESDNEIMHEAMELEIKDEPEIKDEAVNDPYLTPAATSEQSSPREGRPSFNSPSSMLANPSEAPDAPGNMSLQVWANHRICEANTIPSGDTIQQNQVLLAAKSKAVCVAPPPPPPPPPLPPPKACPNRKPQREPKVWEPHDGTCLCRDVTKLPPGYGVWGDWNCPVNIELEKQMTEENELLWKFRGPNPSHVNTPEVWNGIPFNYQKGRVGLS